MLIQFSTKIKAVKRLHTQKHRHQSQTVALETLMLAAEPVWHLGKQSMKYKY